MISAKRIFPVIFFYGLVVNGFSQKNVSKISVSDAFTKTIGISQERAFTKKVSLQGVIKVMPLTGLPGRNYCAGFYNDQSRNPFKEAKIKSLGAFAELRVYTKKEAMNGFYWGPYAGVSIYSAKSGNFSVEFRDPKTNASYNAELKQKFTVSLVSSGLQIGIQKAITKNLRFDWTILGIGISHVGMNGRVNISNTPDDFNLRNFNLNSGDTRMDFEKYFPIKKTIEAQGIILSGRGFVPMLRTGFCVGISY